MKLAPAKSFSVKWYKSLLYAALLTATASAHTAVTGLTPAAFATVSAPKAVQMAFSEPIDLHFCTFKVYPLNTAGNTVAGNTVAGDKVALGRAAAELTASKIGLKNDETGRADTAPRLSGMAAKLSLPLKSGLKPGPYAVIWRILSDDGHIVTGQSVFSIQ